MDDFIISNLHESRNEWCSRLTSIFTPLVIEGVRSIFNESWKICVDNDEPNKYLMTFQNLLGQIPKWNSSIIEEERKRIIQRSGCNYLEDLITCVHIIQLKVLTCIRVGNKQKKIDISVPKLDHFIHKVYINVARKVYSNVYLFEKSIAPLQLQKYHRELEVIVQECIMMAIRDSIPTEEIIRSYLDESIEHEEEVIIEKFEAEQEEEENKSSTDAADKKANDDGSAEQYVVPTIKNTDDEQVTTRLTFNDMDSVLDELNTVKHKEAPKTLERLEEISTARSIQRKLEEIEDDEDGANERLKILTEPIDLSGFESLDEPKLSDEIELNGVEELF